MENFEYMSGTDIKKEKRTEERRLIDERYSRFLSSINKFWKVNDIETQLKTKGEAYAFGEVINEGYKDFVDLVFCVRNKISEYSDVYYSTDDIPFSYGYGTNIGIKDLEHFGIICEDFEDFLRFREENRFTFSCKVKVLATRKRTFSERLRALSVFNTSKYIATSYQILIAIRIR